MAYDSTKPVTGGSLVAADIRENQRAFRIGNYGGGGDYGTIGRIDKVRVYKGKGLAASEVNALKMSDSCTPLVPLITAQSASSVTVKLFNLSGVAVAGNANITIIGA